MTGVATERLGLGAEPRKARPVNLDRRMTDAEAFVVVAHECLDHWRTNEADVLSTRAAPHLHQTRVGIRRLRSAFSLFRPLLRDVRGSRATVHRLRELALPFGRARDLDVLLSGDLVATLPDDAHAHLIGAREAAHDEVTVVLRSPRWAAVRDDVDEVVARVAGLPSAGRRPAVELARAALDRRRHRVVDDRARLREMSDAERHAVRIDAKKLRYGAEFFASLFPVADADSHRGEVVDGMTYAAHAVEVQDALGALNDHAAADDLLRAVGSRAPEVDAGRLLDAGVAAVDRLAAVRPFWH